MLRNITIILAGVSFLYCCNTSQPKNEMQVAASNSNIVEAKQAVAIKDSLAEDFVRINMDSLGIVNNMVYATTNNFTRQKIYPCAECYIREEVAKALMQANNLAKKQNFKLVIFDCYRPQALQQKMFDIVKNPDYVADPKKGSKHNKGCAVDIGLANNKGIAINMGTGFDDFTEKSHYSNAALTNEEKQNRKTLRDIMLAAGFVPYEKEWWHFNFKNTNYQLSNFQWKCLQ